MEILKIILRRLYKVIIKFNLTSFLNIFLAYVSNIINNTSFIDKEIKDA